MALWVLTSVLSGLAVTDKHEGTIGIQYRGPLGLDQSIVRLGCNRDKYEGTIGTQYQGPQETRWPFGS